MSIIETTYCYQADVLLKGKRKPSLVNVMDTIILDVQDVEETPELVGIALEYDNVREYRNLHGVPVTPYFSFLNFQEITEDGKTTIETVVGDFNDIQDLSPDDDVMKTLEKTQHVFSDYYKASRQKKVSPGADNISSSVCLFTDGQPELGLPVINSDDIKKEISSNKEQKTAIIHKLAKEHLSFINNRLYKTSRGPLYIYSDKLGSRGKQYKIMKDVNTPKYLDFNHTAFDPSYMEPASSHLTPNILSVMGKTHSVNEDMPPLRNYNCIILNKEIFEDINHDVYGKITFNCFLGDMIRYNLKSLTGEHYADRNKNYPESLTTYYMEHLFSNVPGGAEIHEAYNLVMENDYSYDSVLNLKQIINMKRHSFSEEQNTLPQKHMISRRKIFMSDHDMFSSNFINNMTLMDKLQETYNLSIADKPNVMINGNSVFHLDIYDKNELHSQVANTL